MKLLTIIIGTLYVFSSHAGVHGGTGTLPPEARVIMSSIMEMRELRSSGIDNAQKMYEFRDAVGSAVLRGDLSRDFLGSNIYLSTHDSIEENDSSDSVGKNVSKIIFEDGSVLEIMNSDLTQPDYIPSVID